MNPIPASEWKQSHGQVDMETSRVEWKGWVCVEKGDRSGGVTQDGMAFPTREVAKKVDAGHGWRKSGTA